MATGDECICIINTAGIIKDAKVLEARSKTLDRLIRMHKTGMVSAIPRDVEESSMMEIRDNAQYLRTGINSFERACDISKLDDRLAQYRLGKDKLEQFRKEPENLNLAIEAGSKIYGAVFSRITSRVKKGLIECKS